jgi:hypothetical protein
MAFLIIAERELRTAARRRELYWLRSGLALAGGLLACHLMGRLAAAQALGAAGPFLLGNNLLRELAWAMFLIILLMGLATADSISRERREGTLPLLLLTRLTPRQIVHGKLLSGGINCFVILLGFLPAMMISVLTGGVGGMEVAFTWLGLLLVLYVSLAAGLWMSASFETKRASRGATLCLLGTLAFVVDYGGSGLLGSDARPLLALFGLTGWKAAVSAGSIAQYMLWAGIMVILGWFFLFQAARALASNQTGESAPRAPEIGNETDRRATDQHASPGEEELQRATLERRCWTANARPWDADPIRWRVERIGSAEGAVWLALLLNFLAQFGLISRGSGEFLGMLSLGAVIGLLGSGALLAWAGGRFFLDARSQHDLELLSTTPAGGSDILGAQWRVLRGWLLGPFWTMLILALPVTAGSFYSLIMGHFEDFAFFLFPLLVFLNVALESLAICWVGMFFALNARNSICAVILTVALVQAFPLALALVLSKLAPFELSLACFFLIKNGALLLWARHRLRQNLGLNPPLLSSSTL